VRLLNLILQMPRMTPLHSVGRGRGLFGLVSFSVGRDRGLFGLVSFSVRRGRGLFGLVSFSVRRGRWLFGLVSFSVRRGRGLFGLVYFPIEGLRSDSLGVSLLFSGRDPASGNNIVASDVTRWLRSETRVWIGIKQAKTFLQQYRHIKERGKS
jgi:hypothetical protein